MQATLLVGGTLVELDPARVITADLVIAGDRLADLGAELPTTSTLDCTGCLILPGLVLGHTHLYSALAAGMPGPASPPTTFKEILERIWWRLDKALDAESITAAAMVGAMAAVRSGVTTIVDHHESPSFIDGSLDLIADALEEVGVRGILTYGATDRHGPAGATAGLEENERFLKKVKGNRLISGAVGLHAPFTCEDQTLEAAADLAERTGAWIHTHAAEGPDDQRAAKARWNERVLVGLEKRKLLGPKTLLAHAVDIDELERELLERSGAWVAHQARSNMNNGVGYAKHLRGLSKVVLGTDGIDQSPLAELQAACLRAREDAGPSYWPAPEARLGAGSALLRAWLGQRFGSLEPGSPADLVVLEYHPASPLDAKNLGGHLLFANSSLVVRDVFVGGRVLLRNRRMVGLDERSILARAQETAMALFKRMT